MKKGEKTVLPSAHHTCLNLNISSTAPSQQDQEGVYFEKLI